MSFYTMMPAYRHLRGINRLHDDIDNLFAPLFGGEQRHEHANAFLAPFMDVTSDEASYTLKVELPGVEPEAVTIQVQDGSLVLSGEKKEEVYDEKTKKHVVECTYGSFRRSLSLPEDADAEAITAKAKDGILTIAIPRKKPEEMKAKSITVERG